MKKITVTIFVLLTFFLMLVCSCRNIADTKTKLTLSFSAQELNNVLASREIEQESISAILEVELYVDDVFFDNRTYVIDSQDDIFSFTFSDIEIGSTVYVKAWMDYEIVIGNETNTYLEMYGESDKYLVKSDSLDLPVSLKWVEGSVAKPAEKVVTVSELKTAIQNYEKGTYNIYKVTGQMSDDEYEEIITLINETLRNKWNWRRYVGLDLSKVTGLSKVRLIYNLSSLTIPNTVTQFSFDLLDGIQILPDNPHFVWDDGVLYSKDKTILFLYSPDKRGETFEIPSGVKGIYPFAFEEANELKEITIPESVIDIGFRAFYKQKLVFKDKENWISDITGKVLTAEELENSENYYYYNPETSITGLCRNGIYKPVIKTVALENIEEAINSTEPYIHTIFKVSGQMDTQAYKKFSDIVRQKGSDEDWPNDPKGYIGFDLTEVTGLSEISSVGDYVFSVAIPETVTKISFLNSVSVSKITNLADNPNFTYEDEVLYSKDKTILYAYSRAKEDTSFTVPSSVKKINSGAFYANFYIQNITIPESVVYIGSENFTHSNIKTLSFGNAEDWITIDNGTSLSKTDIENPANYQWNQTKGVCSGGIYKPQNETITVTASELITALYNYEPRTGVITIYKVTGEMTSNDYNQAENICRAYLNNRIWEEKHVSLDLSEVTGLTRIGSTWSFKTVIIPDTVEEIDNYSIGNVEGLDINPNFKYVNDILYTKDGTTLCFYPGDKTEETFEVPASVTKICDYAFYYNYNLKKITIPESVISIGDSAFDKNLATLIFADANGWYSSDDNQPVSAADVQNPLNYSWNSQTQRNGVCAWGVYKIIVENKTVTASELITALNSYETGTFTIYKVTGAMSYDDYYQAFEIVWEKVNYDIWDAKYVGLDLSDAEGLTRIGGTWCFSTVIIPDTVVEIEDYSSGNIVGLDTNPNFKYVDGVLYTKDETTLCYYPEDKKETSFTIPSTVTKIWTYAFSMNYNIGNIIIPESVVCIDGYAFESPYIKTLTFENKENWMITGNGNNVSNANPDELENPANYRWNNTGTEGIFRRGLFKPETKTVTAGDLENEIDSFAGGNYIIYKVTGSMSNNDYTSIENLLSNKRYHYWNSTRYVGLDLSAVTDLTKISNTWNVFSLKIPSSVSELSLSSGVGNVIIPSDNSNFTYENDILYSADKTILYKYPYGKTDTSFVIPSYVKKICAEAFCDNGSIKSITIPEGIIFIGANAFDSSNIETLTFKNKENWLFKVLNNTAHKADPDKLENTAEYRWNNDTDTNGLFRQGLLKPESVTLTLSELTEEIDSYAGGNYIIYKVSGSMSNDEYDTLTNLINNKRNNYWDYNNYVGLDLSEVTGLTRISNSGCLLCLIIPSSVSELGEYNCADNIIITSDSTYFKYVDDVLYSADDTILYLYPVEKTDSSFTIPSTVKKVWSSAFRNNNSIQSITIPENVVYIGGSAFDNRNIRTLTFADKENWMVRNITKAEADELENPQNYGWNNNTNSEGIFRQGLFKTMSKTVDASDLQSEISSFAGGDYIVYKVTGTMSNDDFIDIMALIDEKRCNSWNYERYVGLDLSSVTGLTSASNNDCIFYLVLPDSV